MNGMKLMVVALASWINQEQNVIDYATAASGLADCFANTTGCGVNPTIPVSGHYGIDRLAACQLIPTGKRDLLTHPCLEREFFATQHLSAPITS